MVADSELQLFVRLRYFVKNRLTVATILVRCDIVWWRLRVATICSNAIFCQKRTHGCDYFSSSRYFMVADSELHLFVRLRYSVEDELTVATILVRGDILC